MLKLSLRKILLIVAVLFFVFSVTVVHSDRADAAVLNRLSPTVSTCQSLGYSTDPWSDAYTYTGWDLSIHIGISCTGNNMNKWTETNINWGDGHTSGIWSQSLNFYIDHVYTNPGNYHIQISGSSYWITCFAGICISGYGTDSTSLTAHITNCSGPSTYC